MSVAPRWKVLAAVVVVFGAVGLFGGFCDVISIKEAFLGTRKLLTSPLVKALPAFLPFELKPSVEGMTG